MAAPKPDEILSLGRRLAPYTAAPYPMLPHHTASAPYPTEDIMRRGRLGMGGTIDTVGETREVGGQSFVSFYCAWLRWQQWKKSK